MRALRWLWLIALLALPGLAMAQQSPAVVSSEAVEWSPAAGAEEAHRETLRTLLEREQVQRVARVAGIDADEALAAVNTMHGDRLANAAQQARLIDEQLVAADDIISIRATTLIIVLLLIIVVLVAAG